MTGFSKKFLILAATTWLGIQTQAQTLDNGPANAQVSSQALLVAVPTDAKDQSSALVIPMNPVAGVTITEPKDIEANKAVIAKAIQGVVTSKEARPNLKKYLASKALKSRTAEDLQSRDAWVNYYYRPYYNYYAYNPYYYNYSNYFYYSYYQPMYYYGGYNYYYYYSYPQHWCF